MSCLLSLCFRGSSDDSSRERNRALSCSDLSVLDDLRTLASNPSWHTSATRCMEAIQATMGRASQAGLYGASPCGKSLVLLGASGPRLGAPGVVGEVISSPWPASQEGQQLTTLTWKVNAKNAVGPVRPPGSWAELLVRVHNNLGSQTTSPSVVQLAPLLLGGRLVGALLCAQGPLLPDAPTESGTPTSCALDTPRAGAGISSYGGRQLRLSDSSDDLVSVSTVLMDCLLAPHADSVQQVCGAAHALLHAPDIATLATVLSSTIADSLTTQLHVDLTVRPALVPAPCTLGSVGSAQSYGFLLVERAPLATAQSQLRLSSPDAVQLHMQRSLLPTAADGGHTTIAERREAGMLERGISVNSQQLGTGPERLPTSITTSRGPAEFRPFGSGPLSPQQLDLRSFLNTGEDAVMSDRAFATAQELLVQSSVGGRFRGRSTQKAWKALPFPLATALLGGVLRDDWWSSPNGTTSCTSSSKANLYGRVAGYGSAGVLRTLGNQSPLKGSPGPTMDALSLPTSTGHASYATRTGVAAVVLPDLHLHLQDIDQPSGELFLLLGGMKGAGAGPIGSVGGAGVPVPPACLLLLVAGSNSSTAGRYGVGVRTEAADVATRGPSLALFLTFADRLPTSLLRAARSVGTRLMEMLMPASMEALTRGPAGMELEDMVLMMLARGQKATDAFEGRDAGGSQSPSGAMSNTVLQGFDRPSSVVDTNTIASFSATNFNFEQPATTGRAALQGPQLPVRPPLPPAPPSARAMVHSRSSMLSRGGGGSCSSTQQLAFTLAPGGSIGDVRCLRSLDPPHPTVAGLLVRRMTDLLPAMSPMSKSMGARGGTTTMDMYRMSGHAPSVPRNRAGASLASASGLSSRARTDLLDLENLGSGGLEPRLPKMEVLLASFFSTLNEAENELCPYTNEDLRFLRLLRVIGEGGCSVVYLGRLLGLEVAVKLLSPLNDSDAASEDGFAGTSQGPAPGAAGMCPLHLPRGSPIAAAGDASGRHAGEAQSAAVAIQDAELVGLASVQVRSDQPPFWVKARQARLRDLMRGVRELAVMSTISHPNIVQIYSYHTNITVIPPSKPDGMPTIRAKAEEEEPEAPDSPSHMAIVMECCDMGSLADALDSGKFKEAIMLAATGGGSSSGVVGSNRMIRTSSDFNSSILRAVSAHEGDSKRAASISAQRTGLAMRAIYRTLLEVALALRHLHSKNLVHCDVKAANVMLKSSASDPRGFTCKLGDFGLVHVVLKDIQGIAAPAQQDSAAGTVTHLAPEYFSPGTKLSFAADMYAFGVVMWEVFTSKPPYLDFAAENFRDLPQMVAVEGLRPKWPPHTPRAYRALASTCWATEPRERPSAASLVATLQRLMEL